MCSLVLPKGVWLINYTFTYLGRREIPVVLMYDSKCLPIQATGTGYIKTTGLDGVIDWRYNGTGVVHSTGAGQLYLKFSSVVDAYGIPPTVRDIILYALPTTT